MSDLYKCDCGWIGFQGSMNNVSHDSHGIAHSCPTCGNSEDDMQLLSESPSDPGGSKESALDRAVVALAENDKLSLWDRIYDCKNPKWERILRDLVKDLTDTTVRF